jgi:hypothetical protein
MSEVELQPDVAEVIQEEPGEYVTDIGVCVKSIVPPVRVQELPRKLATSQTKTVGTTAVRLLRADHWRASAVFVAFEQDVFLAFNEASAQDTSSMSRWPVSVPFTLTAATELWVASSTSTTMVSITTERWATGE